MFFRGWVDAALFFEQLFSTGIIDVTGCGMEDIVLRWDYIQHFLYSHGITRRTISTGEKTFNVSVWEHYNLEKSLKNKKMKHVFNTCLPPTKDTLQKSLVFWQDKTFQIHFMDSTEVHKAETYEPLGFYVNKREDKNAKFFDYLNFVRCDGKDQLLLPVELKYSESTEPAFGFPVLQRKLLGMSKHNQDFPFMIFVMARRFSDPKKSTLGK